MSKKNFEENSLVFVSSRVGDGRIFSYNPFFRVRNNKNATVQRTTIKRIEET
jgi:hypothetical protein